jgi:GNAT superfamily N-acetyltransferase
MRDFALGKRRVEVLRPCRWSAHMTRLDLLAIATDRKLRLEAHRVLRCIEEDLSFDSYTPVDTRAVAEILNLRPQAVSRALRVLSEARVIDRGPSDGRASTFRFTSGVAKNTQRSFQTTLRVAEQGDLEDLIRAGRVGAAYGRDDLRKDIAAGRCWVLLVSGRLVGQLAIRKDPSIEMSYSLGRLLVDRRYRRQGLGAELIAAMEQSLDGNRIYTYCSISDLDYLLFLVGVGFALSGYIKGRHEQDTRLFFGKTAQASRALNEPLPTLPSS